MANKKISQLEEVTTLELTDIFPVVINSTTTPETKRIKFDDVQKSISHDSLYGLANDSHPQYLNTFRHTLTLHTDLGLVPNTRQIVSGNGLAGGGNLSGDLTLQVGAGLGISVDDDTVKLNLSADLIWTGNHTFRGSLVTKHIMPEFTDTYNLGDSTLLWKKGWLSELDTILFAKNTMTLLGGWFTVGKGEGIIPEAVIGAQFTIDFGQAMTLNHIVVFRSSLQVEYIKVLGLVSGTLYNVERDLGLTGAEDWPAGSVFLILGASGDGRIELNAHDTPRISIIEQGSTYDAQTEIIRIGDLNGMPGYSTETYGVYIGDDTNYLKFSGSTLVIAGNGAGVTNISGGNISTGYISADRIEAGTITGTKLSADSIDGKTITGAIVRTAASGARTEMNYTNLFGLGFGGIGGTDGTDVQWYAKATDGKFYAAGGDIIIDAEGISLASDDYGLTSGFDNGNHVGWRNSSGAIRSYISHSIYEDPVSEVDVARLNIVAGEDGNENVYPGMIVMTAWNQSASQFQNTRMTMKDGKITFSGSIWTNLFMELNGPLVVNASGITDGTITLNQGDLIGNYSAVTFVIGDGVNVITNGSLCRVTVPYDMTFTTYQITSPQNVSSGQFKFQYHNGSSWIDVIPQLTWSGYNGFGSVTNPNVSYSGSSGRILLFTVVSNGGAKQMTLTIRYRKADKAN